MTCKFASVVLNLDTQASSQRVQGIAQEICKFVR